MATWTQYAGAGCDHDPIVAAILRMVPTETLEPVLMQVEILKDLAAETVDGNRCTSVVKLACSAFKS